MSTFKLWTSKGKRPHPMDSSVLLLIVSILSHSLVMLFTWYYLRFSSSDTLTILRAILPILLAILSGYSAVRCLGKSSIENGSCRTRCTLISSYALRSLWGCADSLRPLSLSLSLSLSCSLFTDTGHSFGQLSRRELLLLLLTPGSRSSWDSQFERAAHLFWPNNKPIAGDEASVIILLKSDLMPDYVFGGLFVLNWYFSPAAFHEFLWFSGSFGLFYRLLLVLSVCSFG